MYILRSVYKRLHVLVVVENYLRSDNNLHGSVVHLAHPSTRQRRVGLKIYDNGPYFYESTRRVNWVWQQCEKSWIKIDDSKGRKFYAQKKILKKGFFVFAQTPDKQRHI